MAEAKLDMDALMAALDAQRQALQISWRELARQASVSPSSLTRMQQGKNPDVNTFASLLQWLKLPAERFMLAEPRNDKQKTPAHPLAIASTLLRGKKNMTPRATKALEQLVRAAYTLAKELDE
jgi:transcriptional regulator with XRE-family HTH domain